MITSVLRRVAFVLALGVAGHANAQPAPAPIMPSAVGAKVEVEVMVILAKAEPGAVDPRLASMASALKSLPFQSFTLLDQQGVRLAGGEEQALRLTDQRRLKVRLVAHDATQATVKIELMSGETEVLDTTVSVHRNKSFYLAVRGYQGGSLVVPVTVRY